MVRADVDETGAVFCCDEDGGGTDFCNFDRTGKMSWATIATIAAGTVANIDQIYAQRKLIVTRHVQVRWS